MTDIRQARWDVSNLHRHPDYAPVKKEPVEDKKTDDIDLPPRPARATSANTKSNTLALDGDGEFGSMSSGICQCNRH